MDSKTLDVFLEKLRQQRQGLLDWLNGTAVEKRKINVGPAGDETVHQHLQVIETAITKAQNQTLGRCEVCKDDVEAERLEMDFTTSVCIDHYSDEQKRQLESELELSHKVQKSLLPQGIPHIHGLPLAAFSQPARIVGGDYFDFFQFRDGTHGLAIADVMGKGLPASMLMASLQSSLRILVPEHDSPATVAQRLNRLFCHNIHLLRFITLFLGHYDPETRTLTYCNAGHHPPLLWRSQDTSAKPAHWLQPNGAAIGLAERFNFTTSSVTLSPGDVLVLYTDGLTEAMNERRMEFGDARLAETVRQHSESSPKDIVRTLRQAVQDFTGSPDVADDLTLLVGKVER